ncbi:MAG: ATP-binding cassette domain-containing protein [Terriglobales bacterium]
MEFAERRSRGLVPDRRPVPDRLPPLWASTATRLPRRCVRSPDSHTRSSSRWPLPARKPRRRREPRQYDYRLGPGGCGLSSAQRQRLALTRALLRDPAVLILDEATANVDQETERAIMERLRVSRRGRTTLLITHRPSLAAHADRVVAINAGRIDTLPATAAGVAGA